jgi:hypothetical protein
MVHNSAETVTQVDIPVIRDEPAFSAPSEPPLESTTPSVEPTTGSIEVSFPVEPPTGNTEPPFPPERDTAKIQSDKLNDLLATERSTKGRKRRTSKHPKR